MIIDFWNRNGGGGSGSTTDTTMRASGFTGADFVASSTTLSFTNLGGNEVDSVNLSGLTPDLTNYYTKAQTDAAITAYTPTIKVLDPDTGYSSNKVSFVGDNLGYKDTLGTTTTYFPVSTIVKNIVKLTQAEYDLITPSSDTLYLITS